MSLPQTTWRLLIAYHGGRFKGWQRGNGLTVQGTLEEALRAALANAGVSLDGAEIRVNGAGRTDAGAHAEGQVASVVLPASVEPAALLREVNRALPGDVAVKTVERVEDRFHARYRATAKTYRYRIVDGPVPNPFLTHLSWRQSVPLDTGMMRATARQFVGAHDFAAFTQTKTNKSTERTVFSVSIERGEFAGGPVLEVLVRGNGFLWKQVRSMVGALVESGLGRLDPDQVASLLSSRERPSPHPTAPACGLTLLLVEYE